MSVNNINGLNGQSPQRSGESGKIATTTNAPDQENTQAKAPAPGATDSVSLTDRAAQLQRVEAALADVPEVDDDKVAAVRQSIENGSYEVDAGRIADSLLRFESSLNK